MVRHVADRVAVMYLGRVVETAPRAALFCEPLHPYTRALLSAVPAADAGRRPPPPVLAGDVPSPAHPPAGCGFHPRCPLAIPLCAQVAPSTRDLGAGHSVACHMVGA